MKNLFMLMAIFFMIAEMSFAQKATRLPEGSVFYIQSAYAYGRSSNAYWDIGGVNDVAKGENLKIWKLDDGRDREFKIIKSPQEGYYELQIGNWNSRVDIEGGNEAKGVPIQVWEPNHSTAQRFLFHHLGGGRFKIFTTSGKVVCLKNHNEDNGNPIHLWNDHNGIYVEWYLVHKDTKKAFVPSANDIISPKLQGVEMPEEKQMLIQSALSYGRSNNGYWDVPGKCYNINDGKVLKNGANLQVWSKDEGVDRFFGFEKAGNTGFYNIKANAHSSFSVDLFGGKTANGSNVGIYETDVNNPNQQFYFKHLGNGRYKIYHRSGKILCLKGGASDDNGTNVHLWDDHNKAATEWYILSRGGSPYIPADGGTGGKVAPGTNNGSGNPPTGKIRVN